MSYIRNSPSGFSIAHKVRTSDGWREETLAWLGPYMTPAAALEGFTAELAGLEQQAATEDEYLVTRDGMTDRGARWQRHQLGRRIDKVRLRLECVRAYLATEAAT